MPRLRWWLVISTSLIGLFIGLGGAIQPAFAQDHGDVTIVDFAFEPSTIEVSAGATVSWTNTGQVVHTVTADNGAFNSGKMSPGATVTGTFDTPGTVHLSLQHPPQYDRHAHRYRCRKHDSCPPQPRRARRYPSLPGRSGPSSDQRGGADKTPKDKDASTSSQPVKETKLGKVAGVGVGTGGAPTTTRSSYSSAGLALLFCSRITPDRSPGLKVTLATKLQRMGDGKRSGHRPKAQS